MKIRIKKKIRKPVSNEPVPQSRISEELRKKLKGLRFNYPDTRWAVYENHTKREEYMRTKLLAVGPDNKYERITYVLPGNFHYVFVGYVDLKTGKINRIPYYKAKDEERERKD
jgi:hypothetical protein